MRGIFIALALISTPALAEQQPDPAVLQRAIAVLQRQRNQAQDVAASAEIKALTLADELAKAQAKIKRVEKPDTATGADSGKPYSNGFEQGFGDGKAN